MKSLRPIDSSWSGWAPLPRHCLRPDALDSALPRPAWAAHDQGASLVEQAVSLAIGISQSQAFEDGNKRAAFAAVEVFFVANGSVFDGDPLGFANRPIEVAEADRGRRDRLAVISPSGWPRTSGACRKSSLREAGGAHLPFRLRSSRRMLTAKISGAGHRRSDVPPRKVLDAGCSRSKVGLAIDAQAVAQLLELVAVDVVGRVEVLGLGDELQGVVAAAGRRRSGSASNGSRSWA